MDEKIKELTLLLLYLTAWEEKVIPGVKINRSWKGYPFEILDELTEEGLISGGKKARSVHFSEEGIQTAEKLKKKYLKDVNK
jgi:hypothetical protein